MYCKNCGNEIIDGAPFCPNCGANVETPPTTQPASTPIMYSNHPSAQPMYTNSPSASRPAATPNPVAGFVLSIIGLVNVLIAWYGISEAGYYNNPMAVIFAVRGLICGSIARILVLVHRGKYQNLHGIGIVALIFSIAAIGLAVILIIQYISEQNRPQRTINNFLNQLDDLF